MAPFERIAKPFQSVHGPSTYEQVQHQSDGPHLSKSLHYIKAGLVTEFKPALIELLQREFRPSNEIFIYMQNASGAVGDVAPQDTAFWNRKSMANLMILGTWKNPAATEPIVLRYARRGKRSRRSPRASIPTSATLSSEDANVLIATSVTTTRASAKIKQQIRPRQSAAPEFEHRACGLTRNNDAEQRGLQRDDGRVQVSLRDRALDHYGQMTLTSGLAACRGRRRARSQRGASCLAFSTRSP